MYNDSGIYELWECVGHGTHYSLFGTIVFHYLLTSANETQKFMTPVTYLQCDYPPCLCI